MTEKKLRIGTRGSRLALVQAEYVKSLLQKVHKGLEVDIEVVSTRGDRTQRENIALSEIGGKGLFTLEIEEKLTSGELDLAVHSAKDMPTTLPDGLGLVCFPERENVSDAFIAREAQTIEDLPKGSVFGSASLRRRALIWRKRPDLQMVMFRGNVETRLQKIKDGIAEATLLASAGLSRLGLSEAATCELSLDDFPPAPGQGAITIEARLENEHVLNLLKPLNHSETQTALIAERAFLEVLDGSCRTPIGALATINDCTLSLHGIILKPDGTESHEERLSGSLGDAAAIGIEMGKILRHRAGDAFFEGWA